MHAPGARRHAPELVAVWITVAHPPGEVHLTDLEFSRRRMAIVASRKVRRIGRADEGESDVVWGRSLLKKARVDSFRATGHDRYMGIAIDVVHATDFVRLVLVRVLDDAQAIDPEPPEAEFVCDIDGVADGQGENMRVDSVFIGR